MNELDSGERRALTRPNGKRRAPAPRKAGGALAQKRGGKVPDRLILTAALALVAATPLVAAPAPATPSTTVATASAESARRLSRVQSLLDRYVAEGRAPGLVVALGQGDEAPRFAAAGRLSDAAGAPAAGADSLWRIYSMTKPITAIAVMMLVEEGRIDLDQPVADVIPAFAHMRVLDAPQASLASHPARRPVTIRHLLTHTGGLAYQFLGTSPLHREYRRLGLLGGRADAEASRSQPATLAAFAERAARLPLLAEPGTEWHYSIGTDVLGRVIEVVSGLPFDRFVATRLLEPLGMNSTFWTVPGTAAGRLATSYAWVDERRVAVDPGRGSAWLQPPRLHYGGSGLVSSARDYDRFLQMLAGGGSIGGVRILKPETVRLSMSNLLPAGVRVVGDGAPDTARAEGFGAGGWVYLADVPGGVGAGTYGWFGAAGTVAFIDPKHGLRVTLMANYFPANKWPLHGDLVRAVYSPAT